MNIKYPKISVITPSYNQGSFIERTILSIICQNYPNLEYIICDGGSTDDTINIIKKYNDKITWWVSEKDTGQTNAINKGMKKATGDIVCWINSDDILLPGALHHVANFFMNNPDCDFANGYSIEIDKEDRILKFTHIILNKFFFKNGCYNIAQQGMFWKRELFNTIGYLDETFHAKMDVEWLIRVYESNAKIKLIDKNLGAIRVYEETKTSLGGRIWEEDAEKIKKLYKGKYAYNRSNIYFILFILYKFLSGCYFKNLLMNIKYKNKKYTTLKNY